MVLVEKSPRFPAAFDKTSLLTYLRQLHIKIQVVNRRLQVTHIQSTNGAFAAIREHGSVVTWGAKMSGGDSNSVQPLLHNVEKIQSNRQLREDVASVGTG